MDAMPGGIVNAYYLRGHNLPINLGQIFRTMFLSSLLLAGSLMRRSVVAVCCGGLLWAHTLQTNLAVEAN